MRQETIRYVGLDVHKEFCQACVIDPSGRVLSNERFSSTRDELERFLAGFKDAKFVLESTGIWEFIYEGIENREFDVELAHPLKVRAIAEAKVKTDKVDAETLAQLLRANLIPGSCVPSKDVRDLRQLVRQRAYLVRQSTSLKNRIHAELLRRGVRRPEKFKEPFSKKSIDWMRTLGIPTVFSCLNCLENVQAQIEEMNVQLLDEFNRRPDAQLIATIPGIGFYGALLIHAEIDDVRRFSIPEKLCAYAGLAPTVSQSASCTHCGGLSKEGPSHLRWMLTEAVHIHTHCEPGSRLSRFYAKVARRRGKQKAMSTWCSDLSRMKALPVIYYVSPESYANTGILGYASKIEKVLAQFESALKKKPEEVFALLQEVHNFLVTFRDHGSGIGRGNMVMVPFMPISLPSEFEMSVLATLETFGGEVARIDNIVKALAPGKSGKSVRENGVAIRSKVSYHLRNLENRQLIEKVPSGTGTRVRITPLGKVFVRPRMLRAKKLD